MAGASGTVTVTSSAIARVISASPLILSRSTSETIRVARVLCILAMVPVHFWPGDRQIMAAQVAEPLHAFYVFAISYLGRSSVPLLSVVSGVLLAVSFSRHHDLPRLITSKARALLLPMILWSVLMLAVFALYGALTGNSRHLPDSPADWINAVFGLTGPPANIPLGFLRDVFVSALLAGGVLSLTQRMPVAGGLLLLTLALIEQGTGGLLLLRPQILVFFTLGILLAQTGLIDFRPPWLLIGCILGVEMLFRADLVTGGLDAVHPWLTRLAMMLLFWRLAQEIRASDGALWRLARAIEPHIFIIFCSHVLVIACVSALAGRAGLRVTSDLYPLVFVAQLPLIALTGIGLSLAGRRWAPRMMAALAGKG